MDTSHEDDLTNIYGKLQRWWEAATQKPVPAVKTSLAASDAASASPFDGDEVAALREARKTDPHPLGDRPLVVITRGLSGYEGAAMQEVRERERLLHQADLATLSRNGKQVIAEGSRHAVMIDAPDVIVQAVRDVLAAHRERGR